MACKTLAADLLPSSVPLALHCRYGLGQRFGKHVDDSVDFGDGTFTEYTLLIYLTGSGNSAASKTKGKTSTQTQSKESSTLAGGETTFYGMPQLCAQCRALCVMPGQCCNKQPGLRTGFCMVSLRHELEPHASSEHHLASQAIQADLAWQLCMYLLAALQLTSWTH